MTRFYALARPLLRRLPAETAHNLALKAIAAGLAGRQREPDPPILAQRLWGRDFANPIGLAAGFDKNGRAPDRLLALGFGFVEIGTVTPRPQPGNPRPRIFRLDRDGAVINRMGFPSEGLTAVTARIAALRARAGPVGINIGKNRDSSDAAADYAAGVTAAAAQADYLVVNVSSPNTPGLRDLQRRAVLGDLLNRLRETRDRGAVRPPLLVKIAPDLDAGERADIAAVALASEVDGIVIANTTVARPPGLLDPAMAEAGGLSGRPLFAAALALVGDMHRLTRGRLPLIGVGGVAGGADAYAMIRAGASLVQVYTAFVFAGPDLLPGLKRDLAAHISRDGFAAIGDAVGAASRPTGRGRLSSTGS